MVGSFAFDSAAALCGDLEGRSTGQLIVSLAPVRPDRLLSGSDEQHSTRSDICFKLWVVSPGEAGGSEGDTDRG